MPYTVKMGGAPDSAPPGGTDGKAAVHAQRKSSGGSGAGLRMELNPAVVIGGAVALLIVVAVVWWVVAAAGNPSPKAMTFSSGAAGPPIPGPPAGVGPSAGSPAAAPRHGALGPGGPPIPGPPGGR